MGKKKRPIIIQQGAAEWMATYSDLVTLLFCFFVLLYAQASPDKAKIQYIFQAFSSGGEYFNIMVADEDPSKRDPSKTGTNVEDPMDGDSAGSTMGESIDAFEDLYNWTAAAAADSEFSDQIEVEGSASELRIKFDSGVLFAPDSYQLKESGRRALAVITPGLHALQDSIKSIQVQGHTAEIPLADTSPINDWDLSSLRASAVIKAMDYNKVVSSEKFVSEGYAYFTPITENDTEEGRSTNRRVEIIVKKKSDAFQSELFEDIMKYDFNQVIGAVDSDGNPIDSGQLDQDDVIASIIGSIEREYGMEEEDGTDGDGQSGPALNDDLINIPDDAFLQLDEEGNPITPASTTSADSGDGENSSETAETAGE